MDKQKKFKVLLVDDEDIFREATARQLKVRGFTVLTADGGEAALELVKSDPPDVVLLDQEMPGMHGSWGCPRQNRRSTALTLAPAGR